MKPSASVQAEGAIVYNFIPEGIDYTAGKTNTVNVEKGQEVTVDLTVSNDQGTAGMQFYFTFDSNLTFVRRKNGKAYDTSVTWNPNDYSYVWTTPNGKEQTAADGAVMSAFVFTMPEKDGTYTIDLNENSAKPNMVRPEGPIATTPSYDYEFHGLTFVVGDAVATTAESDTPSSSENVPAGTIVYNFVPSGLKYTAGATNKVEVEKGQEVTVDLTVSNDQGTAGMQFYFTFDDNLTFVRRKNGKAYDTSVTWNPNDYSYVWTTPNGKEQTAADGAVMSSFVFTMPEKEGEYTIDLNENSAKPNMVRPEGPIATTPSYNYVFHGLTFVVGDTAAETETTPETTPTPDPANAIVYNFIPEGLTYTAGDTNTVKVQKGQEVTVDLTVKNDQGTAGMQFYFTFDDNLTFVRRKNGKAYDCSVTWNPADYSYVWTTPNGKEQTAADNAVMSSFVFTMPEKEGEYTIDLNENSAKPNMVRPEGPIATTPSYEYVFHGLTFIVGDEAAETTEPTTTTPKEVPADAIVYNFVPEGLDYTKGSPNTVEVAPGQEVTVDLTVSNDQGTAGMQFYFTFDDNLTFVRRKNGKAYDCSVTWNPEEYSYVWTTPNGKEQTAADGAVMSSFVFTMPEKEGEYTIDLNENSAKPNMVRPEGPIATTPSYNYDFHGLTFIVKESADTTTPEPGTTEPITPAGKATWTIDTVECAAGAKGVKVPVYVTGDEGTAGFVVKFDYDSALEFADIEWLNGYTGEATLNPDKQIVVWASADGEDQKAGSGAKTAILNLVFNAPTAAGEYPVTFYSKVEAVNTSQQPLTITQENGAVVVTGETTTTSEPIPAGKAAWEIDKVTVAAGTKDVKVPVYVTGDEGTAGFVVSFTNDAALTFKGFEWADGYTGDATLNNDKLVVVWASDDAADQKAGNGAKTAILNLIFDAPNAAGEYPVEFVGTVEAVNTDGQALTITQTNGAVIVEGDTTTSSEPIPAGKAAWEINRVTATPGQTDVKVPVYVTGDEGTAGFVVTFTNDAALTFKGFEWVDGYTGDATLNNDKLVVVWASEDGAEQKAGDGAKTAILNLIFDAPTAAGEYPVEFVGTVEAVNTDGQALTIEQTNGAVIISETTTEPPVTTTTEPPVTTTEPPVTTTEEPPVTTTEPPVTTEEQPVTTTEPPVSTDEPPVTTTEQPPVSTDEPPVTTTEQPPVTTTEPPVTTTEPPVTTEEPPVTTTTSEPIVVNPGEVAWIIDRVTVPAGTAGVKVPVSVQGETGTAGFVVQFSHDAALAFQGFEWTNGYTGEATINGDKLIVVWADDSGADQIPGGGAKTAILNLIFDAPSAAGEYPVTFVDKVDAFNTDGAPITVNQYNGAVIVTETTTEPPVTTTEEQPVTTTEPQPGTTTEPQPGTTTEQPPVTTTEPQPGTTTEPQPGTTTEQPPVSTTEPQPGTTTEQPPVSTDEPPVTTTEQPPVTTTEPPVTDEPPVTTTTTPSPIEVNPGHVVYQIDDVNGVAGLTVKVPVFVWWDEGTSGFEMQFAVPDGFKISGYEWGDAYPEGAIAWNADSYVLNWDKGDGEAVTATPGAKILTLLVDVPADATAEETYPVTFVPGSVHVSDKDAQLAEYETIDGSIFILNVPAPQPGSIGFIVGNVDGDPGDTVNVPITALTTDPVAGFSITLDVPDGFTLGDLQLGEGFAANGDFTWDPETKTLTWISKDGQPYTPAAGETIAIVPVTIPENATPGDYPINLTNVTAKDGNAQDMKTSVIDGTLTVNEVKTTTTTSVTTTEEPVVTTTTEPVSPDVTVMTSYSIDWTEPGRKYYWSHDKRTYAEANGLLEMEAKVTLFKYYAAADGSFVTADGTASAEMVLAEEAKTLDVTANTRTLDAVNTPEKVWAARSDAHQHKFELEFYFYTSEVTDPDFQGLNGGEPLLIGTHTIYMGVKGDTNLDDHVDAKDSNIILWYYNLVDIVDAPESAFLNDDPELEGLCFFLSDVHMHNGSYPDNYTWIIPGHLDSKDCNSILMYYNLMDIVEFDDTTWDMKEVAIGYDFPDLFYHGWEPLKANP